jgi:hypothetical protein
MARVGHQMLRTQLPQTIRQCQQFDDAPIALSQVGFHNQSGQQLRLGEFVWAFGARIRRQHLLG